MLESNGSSGKVSIEENQQASIRKSFDEQKRQEEQLKPSQGWRCVHTLTGYERNLVALSPGGEILVGANNNTLKTWNSRTGELLHALDFGCFTAVAISPNGKTLAVGVKNQIKLWHLDTGKHLHTLTCPSGGHVNSITISTDGQTLASSCRATEGRIMVWNLTAYNLVCTLDGHSGDVNSLAISPDGQTLVSSSTDKTIKMWNLSKKKMSHTLTVNSDTDVAGDLDTIKSIAISPDGQTLVAGGNLDGTIKLWNMKTGKLCDSFLHEKLKS